MERCRGIPVAAVVPEPPLVLRLLLLGRHAGHPILLT